MRYYDSESGSDDEDASPQSKRPPTTVRYYLESETPKNNVCVILGGHEPRKIPFPTPDPNNEFSNRREGRFL